MQVSLEWLNEYVDIKDISSEEIAHGLTMSGLEVEEIEKTGAEFSNVVVAEILEIKPHPNADKLQLATIFNGKETKEVVCGAKNIAKGQLIPYASVGSEVKDSKTGEIFTLKPAVIRGVESQGMLCSAEELGLKTSDFQEEDGILILNRFKENLKPGQDIKEVLNIQKNSIIHVAPTANRGDEMSVIGIAREVSTIFNRKLKYPEIKNTQLPEYSDFKVEIKDEDTCKYYAAGIIKDVKIKPSPAWLVRRLQASGVRSINNVVDITNYVMIEYGQPLHAFDWDKLEENYLSVRRAYPGEKIITLDEIKRDLTHDSVLIATNKGPVGLAGLMGGYNSEVDKNTKNIVLESAYFTPPTNRKSAKSVGLRTEACARFERGVDIESVKPALLRAIDLLVELADAKICGISETGDNKLPDIEITLRFNQIKRILGIEIPGNKCIQISEHLGFELLGKNDFSAKFLVPSYRVNDVTREIDLIEEIGRIYGYDKIEPTLPRKTQASEISKETETINHINKLLLSSGLNEIVTSSLTGTPLLNWIGMNYNDNEAVKVSNPQSDEYTMLRQSLVPSIVQIVKYNFDQGQKNIWIYEIGKTFFLKGIPDQRNSGVEENRIISGAITGNVASSKWHNPQETDFYTLKGIVESLIKDLGLENRVEYHPVSNISYLHPGRTSEIRLLGKTPVSFGTFGELHPDTMEKCKLAQPVYIFEIDLEKVLSNITYTAPRYKELPLYPAVYRDIAFIIPQNISYQDIAKTIKKVSSNLFKKADIFDVYQGKHVPEGSKSLACRITLQDPNTTLTDEKIDVEISRIKEGLKKAYSDINFRE
ncbi:MAG: phenylalanine--tRNA ligase subunit beta [Candidatus Melainabacteria bacterium GWF2_32_7]|nr:MAG: phenylalanine--tRNA ligase subunit beta [Candidatus Melainabacteria bacterium GWF2_32_7]